MPCPAGCAGGDRIFRCEWVIFVRGRVSVSKAGGGCVFLLLRSRKWELMLFLIIAASSRPHCCACSRRPGLSQMCRRVARSSQAAKGAQRGGKAACGNGPISPIFTAQVLHTRADARTLSASTSPAHEHAGMGKKVRWQRFLSPAPASPTALHTERRALLQEFCVLWKHLAVLWLLVLVQVAIVPNGGIPFWSQR